GVRVVHARYVVLTLFQVAGAQCLVVAPVVDPVLVVGAIGDVCGVHLPALIRLLTGDDDAGGHAQEPEHAAHQVTLVLREIVVDGDHVHALAGQGVQVGRQGGN